MEVQARVEKAKFGQGLAKVRQPATTEFNSPGAGAPGPHSARGVGPADGNFKFATFSWGEYRKKTVPVDSFRR